MGTTVQVLRKIAAKIEDTPGTYDEPGTLMPFTTMTLKQSFDMITDESIVGEAFTDLPVQGMRHVTGAIGCQAEVQCIDPMLEAAFDSESGGVYSFPSTKNEKTLSFVGIDEVKTYKYAGCVLNNFELSSEAEGDLKYTADVIGWKAETRDDTSFPTMSSTPGTRLIHAHCGGTNGYVRIGDQGDALAAGDNQNVSAITIASNWNFAEQPYNDAGTLQLLSNSAGRSEVSFNFTIARHAADTFLGFRDAHTALQADIKYYASATAILQLEISNFVINDLTVNEDDVSKIEVACTCARNGTGTDYSNSNMSFTTAVRASLTNS